MSKYKTWIEIKENAIAHNIQSFKKIIAPKVKLWSVVKSNAYGHGLVPFSQHADRHGAQGFCVDSVPEALKLRKNSMKKPILVLGPTLFRELSALAQNNDITLTVSNFDALTQLAKSRLKTKFHLKIDSGMHRQGFYPSDLPKVIRFIKNKKMGEQLIGVYTHFASAKDINYPAYTDLQFANFQKALHGLEKSGFKNLIRHAAATGGALVNPKYHLDAVRIGIGLYGLWPSKELLLQTKNVSLKPVLSWHALVSEIKMLKKGDYVGYDLVEKVSVPTKIAIIPIGYWHGFPRSLSGIGEILVNGKYAKVIGRVSMDLIVININGISCKPGDKVTIIGRQAGSELSAFDVAQKMGTIHYEFITRINPLIERIST
jgi:alanine racemase